MKGFCYEGKKTREISFPLGGIGSGCIGLSGTGHLVDWEIFNRPAKGSRNGFSHLAVKAESGGEVLDARVLHGDVAPPFGGSGASPFGGVGFGVARETLSGLPHFRSTEFVGGFPFAEMRFRDRAFPGRVELCAFNPFIPLNDADSSLPAAFFTVTVRNTTRRKLNYTLAFTVRNPARGRTTNKLCRSGNIRVLALTGDTPAEDPDYGDFALAADGAGTVQEYWYRGRWFDNLGVYWRDFTAPGEIKQRRYPAPGEGDHGTLTVRLPARAGETVRARFVLAWNVPNCRNYWKPAEGTWKNFYATLFADSVATAGYCLRNWDRLERETRLFRDTLFRSTLPRPVLDAVSANISILKSPTCLRLEDGSFYGWEGCQAQAGCCEGSCTHVWNYAYALPFLFPSLERSMRELDYRYNLLPGGGMPFRLMLPLGSGPSGHRPCVDGQFGGVLKVYREWKISGNTQWLRRLWPAVKKSIEFAWAPSNADRWDPERTGVVHGRQHHTLDMELFGPSAWLTGFYLGALKAGAEMAAACGEPETAAEYRGTFERGAAWVSENLFNGEYFVQQVDLDKRGILKAYAADPAVRDAYWSGEHGELKYQIGEGCGIDQVLAQWHADLSGLGDLFDRRQVRSALRAIYRHNFRRSMRDAVNPCRLYCVDDEAGTTMFAWPKGSRKPVVPIPYAEETMHGFEYQAACHMIMHGMVKQGVRMVKAVRDRYDGEKRNPWNEMECGSNYARSMSSYALLHAFSGFSFDMVRREIAFRPVTMTGEGAFRSFWCVGSAWGEVEFRPSQAVLRVLFGELTLRRVGLVTEKDGADLGVTLNGRRVDFKRDGDVLDFGADLDLPVASVLRVAKRR